MLYVHDCTESMCMYIYIDPHQRPRLFSFLFTNNDEQIVAMLLPQTSFKFSSRKCVVGGCGGDVALVLRMF